MRKLIFAFVSVLCFLAVYGCAADVGEDLDPYEADVPARLKQAQGQPCFPIVHSAWETSIPGAPGLKNFNVRTMNIGSASCSWRISLDVYNGPSTFGTPVLGPYTLATYSGSGPTKLTSQPAPVTGSCSYDVWYRFKPCSTCAEDWFVDEAGPFWC